MQKMNDSMLFTSSGDAATDKLQSLVQDIERLEQEKIALCEDMNLLHSRARSAGVDMKILRQALKLRKADVSGIRREMSLVRLYEEAFRIECHASWF